VGARQHGRRSRCQRTRCGGAADPRARGRTPRKPGHRGFHRRHSAGENRLRARANRELKLSTPGRAGGRGRPRRRWRPGVHDEQFPIDVFQTGSGTSSQHECQRGRSRRWRAGASAARCTPMTIVNMSRADTRCDSDRHPCERRAHGAPELRPGARATWRRCCAPGRANSPASSDRPHAPDDAMPVTLAQELSAGAHPDRERRGTAEGVSRACWAGAGRHGRRYGINAHADFGRPIPASNSRRSPA